MPAQKLSHRFTSRALQRVGVERFTLVPPPAECVAEPPIRLWRGITFAVLFTWVPVAFGGWWILG